MPARVNVYCAKSVAHVTLEMMREELAVADLMTLAEVLELPEGEEAAVRKMEPHLRIEGGRDRHGNMSPELEYAEVYWKPQPSRPIQIERVEDVREEIAETLENLPESDSAGARRVREHLARVVEVVYFEMGIDDSMHLAATLSEVLAFMIAEQGDGLVWFYRRDWASPEDRGENLWTTA
jgi:hypothetical protein